MLTEITPVVGTGVIVTEPTCPECGTPRMIPMEPRNPSTDVPIWLCLECSHSEPRNVYVVPVDPASLTGCEACE